MDLLRNTNSLGRIVLTILSGLFLGLSYGCGRPDPYAAGEWIDLTHDFSEEAVYWPNAESFVLEEVTAGMTEGGYYYAANNFCAAEHGGTHVDAPIHFAENSQTVEQIPLSRLIAPAIVLDVSEEALKNPDYLVSVDDLMAWERSYGRIPDHTILLISTGYGQFWPDREKYIGTSMEGPEAIPHLHFPGIDPDAATWLVENRQINAIGIDTPSIDYGQSTDFMSHRILYEQNIPGFENVANLDQLPATGSFVVALPMKIRNGSGAPLRIVAFL